MSSHDTGIPFNVQFFNVSDINAVLLDKLLECMRKLKASKKKLKEVESRREKEMNRIVSRLLMLEGLQSMLVAALNRRLIILTPVVSVC